MDKEVTLFNSDNGPCAMFDFKHLKTACNEGGHKAILQYVTEWGIFADDTVEKSVLLELKNTASEYKKRKDRFLCFHVETSSASPGKVTVGVHGFFSHVSDPSLLEHLQLKVHMSMATFKESSLQDYTVLNLDFPLRQTGNVVSHCSDNETTANCTGGKHFIQVEIADQLEMVAKVLSSQREATAPLLSGLIKLVFVNDRERKHKSSFLERLHNRNLHSDFELQASDGAVFACHKHVLAAHSPVIATMLQSELEKSKIEKIEIADKSNEVVQSFLDFIYQRDLKIPMENCDIALELLQLAHQYDVDILESEMKHNLLAKPNDWFDMEVALELFVFAKNVEVFQDLKKKAVDVIQSKSDGISTSQFYLDFVAKNPRDALELLQCSFASWSVKEEK